MCQFIHWLFRFLGHFLGGFSRFITCQPGTHSTRLIHLGGQCGHGLTSKPRQSVEMPVTQALLDFFGYPDGAALKLFSCTLELRYSSTSFARRSPSWPVQHQSRLVPEVGSSAVSRIHLPDRGLSR